MKSSLKGWSGLKLASHFQKTTASPHCKPNDTRHCQGHCCSRPWAPSKDLPVASEVLSLADQATDRDGSVPPSSGFSTLQLPRGRAAGLTARRGSSAKKSQGWCCVSSPLSTAGRGWLLCAFTVTGRELLFPCTHMGDPEAAPGLEEESKRRIALQFCQWAQSGSRQCFQISDTQWAAWLCQGCPGCTCFYSFDAKHTLPERKLPTMVPRAEWLSDPTDPGEARERAERQTVTKRSQVCLKTHLLWLLRFFQRANR